MNEVHVWHIRNPDGGSTGLEVANARLRAAPVVLAHALPERVSVEVRDEAGTVVARADDLSHEATAPISKLWLAGEGVARENLWPTEAELGLPVILPGGEAGILTAWWNADDLSAWRWSVELSNRR